MESELTEKIRELVEAILIMGVRRGAEDHITHDEAKLKIAPSVETITKRFLDILPADEIGVEVPIRNPNQKALIYAVLDSDEWTEAEKAVVKWQFRLYGSFYTKLFTAMMSADVINLKRLELAFPDEVQGFRAFREGDELANKIDKAIGL